MKAPPPSPAGLSLFWPGACPGGLRFPTRLRSAAAKAAGLLAVVKALVGSLCNPIFWHITKWECLRVQTSRKILLIATDPDLVGRITECLTQDPLSRASGPTLDVRSLPSLAEAAEACEKQDFDLLVLDLEALAETQPDPAAASEALLLDLRAPMVAFRGGEELDGLRQAVASALARRPLDTQNVRRALYDDFTGLPTQTLLIDLVNQAVARAKRSGLYVALLPFTLRGLEDCEDRFELAKVEKIYKALLGRLIGCLRSSDVVAHFGGADFAILMEVRNGVEDAVLVAERVREIMTDSFVFGDAMLEIAMDLRGPVLCEAEVDDLAALLEQAKSRDQVAASAA